MCLALLLIWLSGRLIACVLRLLAILRVIFACGLPLLVALAFAVLCMIAFD